MKSRYVAPAVHKIPAKKAISKLEDSASSGDAGAALMLAELYARGLGVERDGEKARHWIAAAIDSDPEAVVELLAKRFASIPSSDATWTRL